MSLIRLSNEIRVRSASFLLLALVAFVAFAAVDLTVFMAFVVFLRF